jgi:hypothetical protein
MKTVTEFNGFLLKQGADLVGGLDGEAGTAFKTQHKLEGDKLTHFQKALALLADNAAKKRGGAAVKRVVVASVAEGEKVPSPYVADGAVAFALPLFLDVAFFHSEVTRLPSRTPEIDLYDPFPSTSILQVLVLPLESI